MKMSYQVYRAEVMARLKTEVTPLLKKALAAVKRRDLVEVNKLMSAAKAMMKLADVALKDAKKKRSIEEVAEDYYAREDRARANVPTSGTSKPKTIRDLVASLGDDYSKGD